MQFAYKGALFFMSSFGKVQIVQSSYSFKLQRPE